MIKVTFVESISNNIPLNLLKSLFDCTFPFLYPFQIDWPSIRFSKCAFEYKFKISWENIPTYLSTLPIEYFF